MGYHWDAIGTWSRDGNVELPDLIRGTQRNL